MTAITTAGLNFQAIDYVQWIAWAECEYAQIRDDWPGPGLPWWQAAYKRGLSPEQAAREAERDHG
jgi:hypothetical protein